MITLQQQLNKNTVLHSIKRSSDYGKNFADRHHRMILLDFNCPESKYILQMVLKLSFSMIYKNITF